jgi:putative FmdB family regulatory protein
LTYVYQCTKCDSRFDVIKSVADFDRNEFCESCGAPAERKFTPRVHIHGAAVEHAEYNPGLGCVVKNKKHRAEIAKQRGLVEVGNDFSSGEGMQETFDRARAEKLAASYLGDD